MFNKKNLEKSEISRDEIEKMLKIVHSGDVHRERGGLFKTDGTVTEEPNTGGRFCRSMLILDTDSFDWDKVKALWISNEIEPEEGYFDECCSRCVTAREAKVKAPRLDFVTPAQGNWADAFKIPLAVYQAESPTILGSFDYYDPTGETLGVNFYPWSEQAGIARKDPKLLTATALKAVEFIKAREAQITEEWMALRQEYATQERRCMEAAEQALKELEPLSVDYANAVEKIKRYGGQSPRQPNYQEWRNLHIETGFNSQNQSQQASQAKQVAQIRQQLLSPSPDAFEFPSELPEKIGIPVQAYSNWNKQCHAKNMAR